MSGTVSLAQLRNGTSLQLPETLVRRHKELKNRRRDQVHLTLHNAILSMQKCGDLWLKGTVARDGRIDRVKKSR